MPEEKIAQAVQLLDLMLEHFSNDDHWTRGRYDDGNGGHCLKKSIPCRCDLERWWFKLPARAGLRHAARFALPAA